jgi:hypothetical protein|tara:strand:+ start:1145 stop:1486 length:342 start_codon:yes stop_codon:yes gene_type:complete
MFNKNETIYSSSHLIGVSEPGSNVREITLLALLSEGGALKGLPHKEINEIKDIAIVWKYIDNSGDINVEQIYNHETGEVYWEDEVYHDESWTQGDELIVNSLLMFGELESTIV